MAFESTEHAQAYWKKTWGLWDHCSQCGSWCLMAQAFYSLMR